MKKEELLETVTHWRMSLHKDWPSFQLDWTKRDEKAWKLVMELIEQKPEVTEKWIEEKAWKLRDLIAFIIKPSQKVSHEEGENKLKDFIRSLVKEILE